MSARTYDAMGNPQPFQYPFTPIVKFGDGWAPAAIARTSIQPKHPGETWLQALERVTDPPLLSEAEEG